MLLFTAILGTATSIGVIAGIIYFNVILKNKASVK